jgi:pimeloyl-ACP methyl ester carboxylesterase
VVLLAAAAVFAGSSSPAAPAAHSVVLGKVRIWTIAYRAHNGERRAAYVALPASYRPGHAPPIPLVISPHGRGVTGRTNLKLWGQLPAIGGFAVVSPAGEGRVLANYSWGAAGQIADLARIPEIVRLTLPWVHIDARRIYAVGGSMGGQETLLLLAKHPHLLAGAAAFDPVVNFGLQYAEFPQLGCSKGCQKTWGGPVGRALQSLARTEIGGSPAKIPSAYRIRSPLTYARQLAFSHVPLQIWWSPRDRIVIDQQRQSARLFHLLLRLSPNADVIGFTGGWRHSAEMRAKTRLPLSLALFGLLPARYANTSGVRIEGRTNLASAPGRGAIPIVLSS